MGRTRAPNALDESDEARLTRLSDLAGLAIATAETREGVVNETLAIFRGDLDLETTIERVVATARQSAQADRATCYVHTPNGERVQSVHTTEVDPRRRAYLEGARGLTRSQIPVWQLLLQQDSPTMVVEDLAMDPAIPPEVARRLGAGALVGLRLEHHSVQRGGVPELLGTCSTSRTRDVTRQERTAMESLAGMVSVALANARLHEQTLRSLADAERRAATDPLTGLANHRAFQERLASEIQRAGRHRPALALAVIDLDHFKRVNDSHGHQVGDRVLVEAGRILQGQARRDDLVARMGGEEFAWLMPETDDDVGVGGGRPRPRGRRRAPRSGVGPGHDLRRGLRPRRGRGGGAALRAGRRRPLLGEAARPRRGGALLPGGGRRAVGRGARHAAGAAPVAPEHPGAGAGGGRQGPAHPPPLRPGRRSTPWRSATALGWQGESLARLHEAAAGARRRQDRGAGRGAAEARPPHRATRRGDRAPRRVGADIVADVLDPEQVAWVRGHHERWDGSGYPDGLKGDRIPLRRPHHRVADSWDVMTTVRPYHEPLSTDEALAECRRCTGGQFSGEVVDALETLVRAGSVTHS